LASRALADLEGAETREAHLLALLQRALDMAEHGVDDVASFLLGQFGIGRHRVDQILLAHLVPPFDAPWRSPGNRHPECCLANRASRGATRANKTPDAAASSAKWAQAAAKYRRVTTMKHALLVSCVLGSLANALFTLWPQADAEKRRPPEGGRPNARSVSPSA